MSKILFLNFKYNFEQIISLGSMGFRFARSLLYQFGDPLWSLKEFIKEGDDPKVKTPINLDLISI